jgi:hypothetical protein
MDQMFPEDFGACHQCGKAGVFRSANPYDPPRDSCAQHLARTVQILTGPHQREVVTRSLHWYNPGPQPRKSP